MKSNFNITGMTCSACSAHVEKSVRKLDGVQGVSVNLLQNRMAVEYDPAVTAVGDIIAAVEKGGYGASSAENAESKSTVADPAQAEIKSLKLRLLWSLVFLAPLMYVSMGPMFGLPQPFSGMTSALVQFFLALPVLFINRKFFITGFKALFNRAPNMDSLIAIGASAAFIYSCFSWGQSLYFDSAATILTLITVGKFLEAVSRGKTSDALSRLMKLAPETANVVRQWQEMVIPVAELVVGDEVIVRPGQSIAADGIIIVGNGTVDESALTGESLPIEKAIGDTVTGSTVNKSGYFKFRATHVGNDTALACIIELVRDANATKAPIARLADRVSGVFVPVVIAIAALTAGIWLLMGYAPDFALSMGISVLVISCPCALGLATPAAIMAGTGRGAELGILFKTAASLEATHAISTVVLDKTGTITEGAPSVTDIHTMPGIAENELLECAASVENMSEHPLARAIVNYAAGIGISPGPAENYKMLPGNGVQAMFGGLEISIGNGRMMADLLIDVSTEDEKLSVEGKTVLFVLRNDALIGFIAVADAPKSTSKAAIAEMKALGLDVIMLTGDNRQTAAAVAAAVGIERIRAEILPEDKDAGIQAIKATGAKTAMVGDGINDAPALARADVGIAIGAGTDIAIESADIVLMKSDLRDVSAAIRLSRAVIRNIKQNLFWAFFYNAIGIPLAAGLFYPALGWKLNPMFAAAAMSISSFCVVSNALRLRFFKIKENTIMATTKTMTIEGMSCGHCSGRVEKALNGLAGVSATVDLSAKTATVETDGSVSDDVLKKTVEDAGYGVISIS